LVLSLSQVGKSGHPHELTRKEVAQRPTRPGTLPEHSGVPAQAQVFDRLLLPAGLRSWRHLRWWVNPDIGGDHSVPPQEKLYLRVPASVIAGNFVVPIHPLAENFSILSAVCLVGFDGSAGQDSVNSAGSYLVWEVYLNLTRADPLGKCTFSGLPVGVQLSTPSGTM
jgi:hypothetical protein